MTVVDVNACTGRVIGAALKVHAELGPGLLETTYEACLAHELRKRGHSVQLQVCMPVTYGGVRLSTGYRIDMLVDDCVIVELKTVRRLRRIHEAQLLSYLRLSGHKVGLLINFHVPLLKAGIKRMVNSL